MGAFLGFLAADLAESPQEIKPLDRALVDRISALVRNIKVNPDEDLVEARLI